LVIARPVTSDNEAVDDVVDQFARRETIMVDHADRHLS
jgi:hypothetical protein